ncbi:hypothetical protein COO60DRAFT_1545332, partial [Scenedesmus sp. NREL 46B-D3]
MQRASCHACLLVINISEACKVHKHLKACAAALFIFLLQHNALSNALCTTHCTNCYFWGVWCQHSSSGSVSATPAPVLSANNIVPTSPAPVLPSSSSVPIQPAPCPIQAT